MTIVAMKTINNGIIDRTISVYENYDEAHADVAENMILSGYYMAEFENEYELWVNEYDGHKFQVCYTNTIGGTYFTLDDLGLK